MLDTNVLVSGIFFGGIPRLVLDAWAAGHFELILSPSVVDEYLQTCARLGASYPGLEYQSILATIIGHGTLVPDTTHPEAITPDPDDDKFLLCAQESGAIVVSGDHHLLSQSGWEGISVMKPRDFVDHLAADESDRR